MIPSPAPARSSGKTRLCRLPLPRPACQRLARDPQRNGPRSQPPAAGNSLRWVPYPVTGSVSMPSLGQKRTARQLTAMSNISVNEQLLPSLQRAIQGCGLKGLRQASVEADFDRKMVGVRFECVSTCDEQLMEHLSVAASEVIADFSAPWNLEEEYSSASRLWDWASRALGDGDR